MRAAAIAILVVMATLLAGAGFAIVTELANLKAEVATIRRDLAGARERLARFERREEQTLEEQSQSGRARANQSLKPADERASPPFDLTREEIQLVKEYIKVPPAPAGNAPSIAVGTSIPPGALMPLPAQISEKFPRLDGARFLIDPAGAIVLVRRGSRRADAIIPPN